MGVVAFKRILGLTAFGFAAGFALEEIASRLQEDDWIVDVPNQEIYKPTGGWCVKTTTSYVVHISDYCSTSPVNAVQAYLDYRNALVRSNNKRTNESGVVYYNEHTKYVSPVLIGTITPSTLAVEVRVDYQISSGDGYGPSTPFAQIFLDKIETGKVLATPADVAAVLPDVSDSAIADLMVSPDYLVEPHAPTAEAAAAAAPSSEPIEQATSTLGSVKTETQTTTNPDGSTTKTTTTTTTNPDGTKTTQTATTTTNPDGSTTTTSSGTKPADMPAFCNYAKTLCDWILWTKQEPQLTPVPEIPKREISRDELPTAQQINFGGGCPAGETFQAFGQTVTLSYGVACDLMNMIKPFVILAGNVTALFIFINSIRN